jgi:hypothetical protein
MGRRFAVRRRLALLLLTVLITVAAAAACRWQAPGPPWPDPLGEAPPRHLPAAVPPGTGGLPDENFTTDHGAGLDEYRGKGRVLVPVRITRYFGPTDEQGRLRHPDQVGGAALLIRAWDLDSTFPGGTRQPEVLRARVNGVPLEPDVTGLPGRWTAFSLPVPVESLRFPDAHGPVREAVNWVEIEFDPLNETAGWKAQVDWVRLRIAGVRPWVLVHGFLSDASAWAYWTGEYAPDRGIPTHAFSMTDSSGSMWVHGDEVLAAIREAADRFGVSAVHLVGSSKGGPDGRVALAGAGTGVQQFVMLGSPHLGSELADLVKIGAILHPSIGAISRIGEPALTELTTWYSRLATARIPRNPAVTYATITAVWRGGINPLLPGPDDGVVSTYSAESLPFAPVLGRTANFHTENVRTPAVFELAAAQLAGGARTAAAYPAEEAPQISGVAAAHMAAGSSRAWQFVAEPGVPVSFLLLWTDGAPALSVYSPAGERFWGGEVRSLDAGAGLRYQVVHIASPAGGPWRLAVDAGPEPARILLASASHSALRLAAELSAPHPGDPIWIQASLPARTGGAAVTAHILYPNGSVAAVPLAEAGRAGTGDAAVLLYAGSVPAPEDAYGDLPVVLVAEQPGGWSRFLLTGVMLPHRTARVAWQGIALAVIDGDGAAAQLAATVRLEEFPVGRYLVLGRLSAAKEESLFSWYLPALVPESGTLQLQLRAPAAVLYQVAEAAAAGSISLDGLFVFDGRGRLVAGGSPLPLTPEELRLHRPVLRVETVTPAEASFTYRVTFTSPTASRLVLTARLEDGKGTPLGWAVTAGRAAAGRQTWTLAFRRDLTAEGPFRLRDLSLYEEARPERAVLLPDP